MRTKLAALACASALLLAACGPKKTSAEAESAIGNNLRQFDFAAQQYFLETGKEEAGYPDLVGEKKYITALRPVNGEDYTGLVVTPSTKALTVTAADGTQVTHAFGSTRSR